MQLIEVVHFERKNVDDWVGKCRNIEAEGSRPVGDDQLKHSKSVLTML